jgi:hypothetical protein
MSGWEPRKAKSEPPKLSGLHDATLKGVAGVGSKEWKAWARSLDERSAAFNRFYEKAGQESARDANKCPAFLSCPRRLINKGSRTSLRNL